jgi:hypothetical protein
MKRSLIIISGACALMAPVVAQEVRVSVASRPVTSAPVYRHWTAFTSAAGGFEVPVPPGVRALTDSRTGARASFASVDGTFRLAAWGGLSVQPGELVMDAKWREALGKRGRTVTRNGRGPASFAVTGSNSDGTQFFEKLIRSGDHIATVSIKWPASRRREFSPWIQTIDEGFNLVAPPKAAVPADGPVVDDESALVPFDFEAGRTDPLTIEEAAPSPGRESASTTVDVTPPDPPKKETGTDRPGEESSLQPAGDGSFRNLEPPRQDLPVAVPVPGKRGFVYSPFFGEKKLVDAVDLPSGAKVKCPYTGKHFRLP